MRLDFARRQVHLSVGALARFHLGPSEGVGAGRWRAALGQAWHDTWQTRATAQAAEAGAAAPQFEVSIKGLLEVAGWQVHLQGRIDQVRADADRRTLCEIKTVRRALPVDPAELHEAYPEYIAQAALYHQLGGALLPWQDKALRAELVFIDLNEGLSQTLPLESDACTAAVQTVLARLGRFLTQRQSAQLRLRAMTPPQPFPTWREGQPAVRAQLTEYVMPGTHAALEAPTGFGKTGLVLERAFQLLQGGLIDRVIFTTSRATGQTPLRRQLQKMAEAASGVRWFQLLSQLAFNGPQPLPDDWHREARLRWEGAQLDVEALFAEGTVTPETVQALGERWAIPPFTLARCLLPAAECWLLDLNYVFAARQQGVLEAVPGFDPARTFLCVDEAHHLPGRVAAGWSLAAKTEDFQAAATEAQLQRLPEAIWRPLDRLADLAGGPARETLPVDEADQTHTALVALRDAWREDPIRPDEVSDWTRQSIVDWAESARVGEVGLPTHSWRPHKGELRIDCLDASPEIHRTLSGYAGSLMLSATFPPAEAFAASLGRRSTEIRWLQGEAPWRERAYAGVIDARMDTRYKARERSIPQSAQALLELQARVGPPVVVFFSSYAYAGQVAAAVNRLDGLARFEVQPKGLPQAEQLGWVEGALRQADFLGLVLGGSFTEAIDALGGQVAAAVVIGPALPEVNGLQRARLDNAKAHGLSAEAAFQRVYQIPGLIKVNQALGRLVRGPGQKALVVLQGRRFAEPAYRDLLEDWWAEVPVIHETGAWQDWLAGVGP